MVNDLTKIITFSTNFTGQESNIVNKKLPVLIFDPGCGEETQKYENIIEDMVSNGYIVLGINNTFIGTAILFPDGRIVHDQNEESPVSIRDLSVLNDIMFIRQLVETPSAEFASLVAHMDLNHVGLIGHSMGGISVVKAIRDHSELFQAAISLDAPPIVFGVRNYSEAELAGFPNTPFMRLFGAEWRTLAGLNIPKSAKFELLKNNYYVLLSPSEDNNTYTGHMNFSDYSTLQYQPLLQFLIPVDAGDVGTANGWYIARLDNMYVLEFFNKYLKGISNAKLETCQPFSKDSNLACGVIMIYS